MLQGEVITDGWNSAEVKEALDACLACKGCKSDCPTHTDMASYKAEFLSHYYENHRRPRQALFMGRIGQWAPFASRFPSLTNFLTSSRPLAHISKWIAGVAPERDLPVFAPRTFRKIARDKQAPMRLAPASKARGKVILWVDTFNDHFSPEVATAAYEVLSRIGYEVVLPRKRLCCGRPLYDYGLLDEARTLLRTAVQGLAEDILDGVPVVGLEPGCLSIFKDELLKQLPDDPMAKKLSGQTYLFSDFLALTDFAWPALDADVVVHGHCHQKSIFGMKGETALLDKLGVRWKLLDTGCCGMAGSFGFSSDHHEMSMKIGEDKLLPLIRETSQTALVVTNGFSCREQIVQATGRESIHIAQLALKALAASLP
jgi:Fe-S oxidoreductase